MTQQKIKIIAFYLNFIFMGLGDLEAQQLTANITRSTLESVQKIAEEIKPETLTKENILTFLLAHNMPTTKQKLYILNQDESEYYKIGLTNNINNRLRSLQSGNPKKLNIVFIETFYLSQFLEKAVFKIYEKNYIFGEWYQLTKTEVKKLIKTLNTLITKL